MTKRILFFGNCQAQVLSSWFGFDNGDWDVQFESVTSRFLQPTMTTEEVFAALSGFDVLVTNPIMNERNGFYHLHLKEAMKGETVFVPYVYVDGVFSLEISYETWGEKIFGAECLSGQCVDRDFAKVCEMFRSGEIGFNNRGRFERTLTEMAARELHCNVHVADIIRGIVRDRLPVSTHNHPSGFILGEMLRQICRIVGGSHVHIESRNSSQLSYAGLPPSPRAFTPFDVAALGLKYPHDDDWFEKGRHILERFWHQRFQN